MKSSVSKSAPAVKSVSKKSAAPKKAKRRRPVRRTDGKPLFHAGEVWDASDFYEKFCPENSRARKQLQDAGLKPWEGPARTLIFVDNLIAMIVDQVAVPKYVPAYKEAPKKS